MKNLIFFLAFVLILVSSCNFQLRPVEKEWDNPSNIFDQELIAQTKGDTFILVHTHDNEFYLCDVETKKVIYKMNAVSTEPSIVLVDGRWIATAFVFLLAVLTIVVFFKTFF